MKKRILLTVLLMAFATLIFGFEEEDLEKFLASRNAKWEVWAKDRGMWEYLEAEYVEWLSGNIDAG